MKTDSLSYVRRYYGVPARRGMRVRYRPYRDESPQEGRIVRGDNYVWVRFDDTKFSVPCHPTWKLDYLAKDGSVL